jgi:hypothetical protein
MKINNISRQNNLYNKNLAKIKSLGICVSSAIITTQPEIKNIIWLSYKLIG